MSIADLKVRLADVQGIETLSTASEQGGSYFDGALAIPPRRRGGVRQRNDSSGDAVRDPETGDVTAKKSLRRPTKARSASLALTSW